jgi:hypothetical protein
LCIFRAGLSFAADRPAAEASPGLLLAADGKAELPIVISPRAAEGTQALAKELAQYLSRLSGATFEVRQGDGSRGIVLGTLAEFPQPELAGPLEIRNTYDGKEAYAIRTQQKRLLLIGATELGASHAAFRLLESLGCRWFFPAPQWEIVPHCPKLVVRLDETDRPALLSRRIWYGYGFFADRTDRSRCQTDYEAWARHNRMAASLRCRCGHAWQSIIADNKKLFEAHPEYLALVGGKRQGPQLCVSNAELRKLAARWAVEKLRQHPEFDMASMECSDGNGQCECESCAQLGSISDRVFGLANEVARAVARECPGKMVGVLAYNQHCEPPAFALEPNVYVQSTAGFICGKYTFEELMELWPKHCRSLGFYDYLSVWLWDWDMPPAGRAGNLKYLREQIPRYAELHATSIDCESGNNWGLHGLGYYVANKLMWNPKADVDALLADFFRQAFGPAAAPMRRYYQRLDPGKEPLVSEHLLASALRDLEEASRLAKDRPDVLARLEHLKQYQHYVRLRWEHDRTQQKDRQRELTLAALTHVYRTRFTYMNHWQAMSHQWVSRAADEYDFLAKGRRDHPWDGQPPYMPQETERLFQEDLAWFQPQPVEEKSFSADLVPAGLSTPAPATSNQRYQRGARYALYSRQGEPLELTISTGLIAHYRDRPAAAYTLFDAAGKTIAQGRLPQDGAEHRLAIEVPRPGLYWLDFDDRGAGWGIAASAGRPVALAMSKDARHASFGQMQRMFFYVPKGTRCVDYFWDGSPHEVCGPDGKVVAKVDARGKCASVAVPPGGDGKPWSLNKFRLQKLWFFNVPNYLAASPDALLIPREPVADSSK